MTDNASATVAPPAWADSDEMRSQAAAILAYLMRCPDLWHMLASLGETMCGEEWPRGLAIIGEPQARPTMQDHVRGLFAMSTLTVCPACWRTVLNLPDFRSLDWPDFGLHDCPAFKSRVAARGGPVPTTPPNPPTASAAAGNRVSRPAGAATQPRTAARTIDL